MVRCMASSIIIVIHISLREDLITYVKFHIFSLFVFNQWVSIFLLHIHAKCHVLIASGSLIYDITVQAK